jgi:hypothetical protein
MVLFSLGARLPRHADRLLLRMHMPERAAERLHMEL